MVVISEQLLQVVRSKNRPTGDVRSDLSLLPVAACCCWWLNKANAVQSVRAGKVEADVAGGPDVADGTATTTTVSERQTARSRTKVTGR